MVFKLRIGAGKAMITSFVAAPGKFLNWILSAGFWDDSSQWLDGETWKDGEE